MSENKIGNVSQAIKKLAKGEYLFKEGDAPDAMYVIRNGRLEVLKTKADGEVQLAELGPGSMVGEMGFFDQKPRSASVRALKDSEVIVLPYRALVRQFATFPEWLKAIMKSVNEHLRKANQRIKELEKAIGEDDTVFPPQSISKLFAILGLVTYRYGKEIEGNSNAREIHSGILRKFTIQVFGEATHKMNKLLEILSQNNLVSMVSTGDGYQIVTLHDISFILEFADWHTKYMFQKEEERINLDEKEITILEGILHFAKKVTPEENGFVKINLEKVQNESMRELGDLIRIQDINPLIEKKVLPEKFMDNQGTFMKIEVPILNKIVPFWKILLTLKKITR